jgi:hypothetical protein
LKLFENPELKPRKTGLYHVVWINRYSFYAFLVFNGFNVANHRELVQKDELYPRGNRPSVMLQRHKFSSLLLCFLAVRWIFCQVDNNIQLSISIHTPSHGDYWPVSNGNLTMSVLFTSRLGDVIIGIRMNDLIDALNPDPLGSRLLAQGDLGIVLLDTTLHGPSPSRYIARLRIPSETLRFSTTAPFQIHASKILNLSRRNTPSPCRKGPSPHRR